MQNPNDCLQEAMFIASESYSGSTYEVDLFRAMEEDCEETVVMVSESGAVAVPAIAV